MGPAMGTIPRDSNMPLRGDMNHAALSGLVFVCAFHSQGCTPTPSGLTLGYLIVALWANRQCLCDGSIFLGLTHFSPLGRYPGIFDLFTVRTSINLGHFTSGR